MSRKTLRMNRFGESILSELDSFTFYVTDIYQKYPPGPCNNPDVYKLLFNWNWNGYNGYGEIHFFKSSHELCNKFGENESSMTVHSNSKRQQPNGRSNCALYNDASLEPLFCLILSKTNLEQAKAYPF
jgi:hypothetical protein